MILTPFFTGLNMKRPTSVSVIAWIFIVTSVLSLAVNFYNLNNPMVRDMMARSLLPVSLQFGILFVGLVITVISGVGLLKRFNWSRMLYIGWSLLATVVTLITSPMKVVVVPGLVVLGIIAFFLYRPKVNAWFAGQPVAANDA
jgi:hypothetical protein